MRWGERDGRFAYDLRSEFFDHMPPFVYGVGTWFGPGVDEPQPFFIVDETDVTVRRFALPRRYGGVEFGGDQYDRPVVEAELGYRVEADITESGLASLVVGRAEEVSNRARSALGNWLPEAVIMPAARPEALVGVGTVLIAKSTAARGTVGAPVQRRSHPGILTAGHVVGGPGETLLKSSRWWRRRGEVLGSVSLCSDPIAPPGCAVSTPGYDIAVVDLDPRQTQPPAVSTGVARLESAPPMPIPIWVHRGFGRPALGVLVAGLQVGGPPWRQWIDCWIVTPGHLASQGDSGAAVVTATGELLGTLVGGAKQGVRPGYAIHYVQDYESTETALLSPAGVSLR